MIVSKLSGGIGNQMFQYAFGRATAIRLNTELKLDKNWFSVEGVTKRNYALGDLRIKEVFIGRNELKKYLLVSHSLANNFPRLVKTLERLTRKSHIYEKYYFKSIAAIPNNSYLEGEWASEKYFYGIKSTILEEFSLKKGMSGQSLTLATKIQNQNSIALHIRRGDYFSNDKVKRIFGICTKDYYNNALRLITRKIKNPILYVFTDDIPWVKGNFSFNIPFTIVPKTKAINDASNIILMSKCKHNIISNSTFGWWGAWLNTNPKKVVVAPKIWTRHMLEKDNEIVPESWVRI